MKGREQQSWSVAELVPVILLSLVGLNVLLVAPTWLPSSTIVPQKTPRLTPVKPLPANPSMFQRSGGSDFITYGRG